MGARKVDYGWNRSAITNIIVQYIAQFQDKENS